MFRITSCILATMTICTAACAQPPMFDSIPLFDSAGNVDIDTIRNRVLSDLSMPITAQTKPAPFADRLDVTADVTTNWGLQLMPVPNLLRPAHESLAESGLLVLKVRPNSPAMRMGIQSGMVLLSVDEEPLQTLEDLPAFWPGLRLHVLTDDGLRFATVKEPKHGSTARSTRSASASSSSSHGDSISVRNVNGLVLIDATLKTQDGEKRLVLEGTPAEIERQIDQLPADLAKRLRQQASY